MLDQMTIAVTEKEGKRMKQYCRYCVNLVTGNEKIDEAVLLLERMKQNANQTKPN